MPEVGRVAVIDAGFGGLGVVAALDPAPAGPAQPDSRSLSVRFLNATPSDAVGFNQLPDEAARLHALAAVLQRARAEGPDGVFVACNTLSTLLPALGDPAPGIVDAGVALLAEQRRARPDEPVLLLGTQTTVGSGLYPRRLAALGLDPAGVVGVPCPRLETLISRDPDGAQVRAALHGLLAAGLAQLGRPERVALFLGCTHYGYREAIFAEALAALGPAPRLLNPNHRFAAQIRAAVGRDFEAIHVRFLSRYRPPPAELHNVPRLLAPLSQATAAAVRQVEVDPGLF